MKRPLSVLVKPTSSRCNLNCGYCFYLRKAELYPWADHPKLTLDTYEIFLRQYVDGFAPPYNFAWQGGEPTLLGRSFFTKALAFQRRHCPPGLKISNALQTNGTLLNERWAVFLREHDFLVGLSIDGPRRLHDRYRETRKGAPTFDAVRRALRLLHGEGVAFNTLTVVHRANARHGRETYRFLRDEIGRAHV